MSELVAQAEAAIGQNDFPRAEALGKRALQQDPEAIGPRLILGAVYARTRRLEDAIRVLKEVLEREPQSIQALDWLSDALRKLGRFDEALAIAEGAIALIPGRPEGHFSAGSALLALGRFGESEARFRTVLAIARPPSVLHLLAACLIRQDRPDEAVPLLEEARRLEPRVPNHVVALGQARITMNDYPEAAKLARQALSLRPEDVDAKLLLAHAEVMAGNPDGAEQSIKQALIQNPRSAEALGLYGMWLHQMGRFDEAEAYFDDALTAKPGQAMPLYFKMQSRKIKQTDLALISAVEERLASPMCLPEERIAFHYALGKAFDDLRDPAKAFQHFDSANALRYAAQQRQEPYEPKLHEQYVDKVLDLFTKPNLDRWSEHGNPSDRPVFIVGMIRSGTTLMEQLLSAHPKVAGAGELHFWPDSTLKMVHESTQDLSSQTLNRLAEEFLAHLQEIAPDGRHVTDKMPTNVQSLGFIHASLPNAKVIHIIRDPLDVALSIWMTYIRQPPPFTSDKNNIKLTLAQHDRLRDHWATVLPADRYLQVQYETLTRQPEQVMRNVLEFLGLEWNEDCIHPERNERIVSTPSMYRVRRPIDASSVRKADRYGPYLGEFADLL